MRAQIVAEHYYLEPWHEACNDWAGIILRSYLEFWTRIETEVVSIRTTQLQHKKGGPAALMLVNECREGRKLGWIYCKTIGA